MVILQLISVMWSILPEARYSPIFIFPLFCLFTVILIPYAFLELIFLDSWAIPLSFLFNKNSPK